MRKGREGGQNAAVLLKYNIEKYLKANIPGAVGSLKIVIRLYADILGLHRLYNGSGNVLQIVGLEEFIRGFNMADPLCDFVDAGTGKGCTNIKLNGKQRS